MLRVVYSTLVLGVNVVALMLRVNANALLMLNVTMVAGLRVVCGFGFCRINIATDTETETVDGGLSVLLPCVSLDLAGILTPHHALGVSIHC